MPRLALFGYLLFTALAFGWRSWVQWRRTGSTGFRGVSGRPGSAEWLGGTLFVLAVVLAPLAAVLDLYGVVPRLAPLDGPLGHALGAGLFVLGLCGTLWSQVAMGDSWRIGVDVEERTALVTGGPYRTVRNPIFTSMILAVLGLALLTPNVVALAALAALVIGVEVHVKVVEEPYLESAHGDAYRAYRARTWRFVPGFGR